VQLEYEFTYQAKLKQPLNVGAGPYGVRTVFEVVDGVVEGKRLNGTVLSGGADWMLVGADGCGRLDVRAQFATKDNAIIYVCYLGVVQMNEAVQQAVLAGKGTEYTDQYFRTAPRLETGDSRYAWVNQSLFVAEGRFLEGPGVEYKVHRVA
jgi:Protein of unknown function (DUF3237)